MVEVSGTASTSGALVCGPGSFHFSAMSCHGERFEYKKDTAVIRDDAWAGGSKCTEANGKYTEFPYKTGVSC